MWKRTRVMVAATALLLLTGACGSSTDDSSTEGSASEPSIIVAVTTNILGDVVTELIGDQAEVFTVMPVGADPHDFQASAQEVDRLLSADLVITNGADFEEGLTDVIDSARSEGVPVIDAIEFVSTIEFGSSRHSTEEHSTEEDSTEEDSTEEHSTEEHSTEEHSTEEHSTEEHSTEAGVDPHFFTDPARMIDVVSGLSAAMAEIEGVDVAALQASTDAYLGELAELDAEVVSLLEGIPTERRVLVTNHEVFGYVADRFGFEIIGVVVPGGSTGDAVSAGDLADLADAIEAEGVPAIFVDTSSASSLAETLAAEVGDIEIVELYTESLGEQGSAGESYLDMVRSNTERVASALR